MLIEFRCSNLSEYDAALGRYVECGEMVVASDDDLGQMATCPKCGQMIEIPYDYSDGHRTPDRPPTGAPQKKKKLVKPTQRRPASKPTTGSSLSKGAASTDGSQSVKADVMGIEFSTTKGAVHDSSRKRCPECGSLMDDHGRCSLCHYVEPKFQSKTAPIDDIKIRLAGCQLWLSEIVDDGASGNMLKWGGIVLVTVLYVILTAISVLMGQFSSILFAVGMSCLYALFILTVIKAGQMARNRRARIGWWMNPFWIMLLWAARAMNWQNYDQRFAGRTIVDLRNEPITDDKIPRIEDLKKCQVLDLENTLVTDQALLHLYGLTQLHCLVLRNSNVSHDGVFRIQQAHPRLWIWY